MTLAASSDYASHQPIAVKPVPSTHSPSRNDDISSFKNSASKLDQQQQSTTRRNNSKSGSKPRYDLSSSAIELSGLALNLRKQTSPAGHERVGGTVVVTVQQANECSYDHGNGTHLLEESPGLIGGAGLLNQSSPSLLNPYLKSGEMSSKRFSSSIGQNKGMSPANIKLEPIRVAPTSCFNAQANTATQQQQSSVQAYTCKTTVSPVKEDNQFTLQPKTEESPDAGNPILAQKIYENLKIMQQELLEGTYTEHQPLAELNDSPLENTSTFQSVQTTQAPSA